MSVVITLVLETGEHYDSTQDTIESAQNQMRSMDFEELLDIMEYVIDD